MGHRRRRPVHFFEPFRAVLERLLALAAYRVELAPVSFCSMFRPDVYPPGLLFASTRAVDMATILGEIFERREFSARGAPSRRGLGRPTLGGLVLSVSCQYDDSERAEDDQEKQK